MDYHSTTAFHPSHFPHVICSIAKTFKCNFSFLISKIKKFIHFFLFWSVENQNEFKVCQFWQMSYVTDELKIGNKVMIMNIDIVVTHIFACDKPLKVSSEEGLRSSLNGGWGLCEGMKSYWTMQDESCTNGFRSESIHPEAFRKSRKSSSNQSTIHNTVV